MANIQKITPNLWFDRNGEEAAKFYTSVFKNSSLGYLSRYGKAGFEQHQMPEGTAMTIEFTIEGQQFLALNGGPHFTFSEAISFVVNCDDQKEVDYYWEKLTVGGDAKAQMCGWLKDKFGLSWQIVPTKAIQMLKDKDPAKSQRVMAAIMHMKKIDLPTLEAAYDGK